MSLFRSIRQRAAASVVAATTVIAPVAVSPPPAHAATGITISHIPPSSGIAGDSLDLTATFTFNCDVGFQCSNRVEKLHYIAHNGAEKVIERTFSPATTGTASDTWNVSIPAQDVGFPNAQYWFTGKMRTMQQVPAALATNVEVRQPVLSDYTPQIEQRVRFRVQDSAGNPIANTPVTIFGKAASAVWETTTDSTGRLNWLVPRAHWWVDSVAFDAEKQTFLLLHLFTGTNPSTVPPVGTPATVTGEGLVLAWQLNLGNRDMPVVTELQDQTGRLAPTSIAVYNPDDLEGMGVNSAAAGSNEDCYPGPNWRTCFSERSIGAKYIPVAKNLGGGWDVLGTYEYTNNSKTATSIGVDAGSGWAEAKGKVQAEENREVRATSDVVGPNKARDFEVLLDHAIEQRRICYYNQSGAEAACRAFKNTKVTGWGGGIHATAVGTSNFFDAACNPADGNCNDYTVPMGSKWEATVEKGAAREFSFTLGLSPYEWVGLHAETEYAYRQSKTQTVTLTFSRVANPAFKYLYIFVPSGTVANKTPASDPGWAYTEASDNGNLTNTTPQDFGLPCVSCELHPR